MLCVEVVLAVAVLLCRVIFFSFFFNLVEDPLGLMKQRILFVLWARRVREGLYRGPPVLPIHVTPPLKVHFLSGKNRI